MNNKWNFYLKYISKLKIFFNFLNLFKILYKFLEEDNTEISNFNEDHNSRFNYMQTWRRVQRFCRLVTYYFYHNLRKVERENIESTQYPINIFSISATPFYFFGDWRDCILVILESLVFGISIDLFLYAVFGITLGFEEDEDEEIVTDEKKDEENKKNAL